MSWINLQRGNSVGDIEKNMANVRIRRWFQKMMYVSGETAEASSETTGMIEEIVRQQVIEMVSMTLDSCNPQRTRVVMSHDINYSSSDNVLSKHLDVAVVQYQPTT